MKRLLAIIPLMLTCFYAQAQYTVQRYEINTAANGVKNLGGFTGLAGETIFFINDDNGSALWKINGSVPNAISSTYTSGIDMYANFCALGNTLYYSALCYHKTTTPITVLWKYDGASNPQPVEDKNNNISFGFPTFKATLNGMLYCSSPLMDGSLWQYDPSTNEYTQLPIAGSKYPSYLTAFNNSIYYRAETSTDCGLYKYDPATGQSQAVANASFFGTKSYPSELTVANNKLYFFAKTANFGDELFEYDGYQLKRLTDIGYDLPLFIPGPGADCPLAKSQLIGSYKGDIYFSAVKTVMGDRMAMSLRYNTQTGIIDTIVPPQKNGLLPSAYIAYGGALYFVATIAGKSSIWRYDGTGAPVDINTLQLPYSFTNPHSLTESFGSLCFAAEMPGVPNRQQLYIFTDAKALAVAENKIISSPVIYPNPAHTTAHIAIALKQPAEIGISLTDTYGKLVYTQPYKAFTAAKHTIEIPLQNLPVGIYTYTIRTERDGQLRSGIIQKY